MTLRPLIVTVFGVALAAVLTSFQPHSKSNSIHTQSTKHMVDFRSYTPKAATSQTREISRLDTQVSIRLETPAIEIKSTSDGVTYATKSTNDRAVALPPTAEPPVVRCRVEVPSSGTIELDVGDIQRNTRYRGAPQEAWATPNESNPGET